MKRLIGGVELSVAIGVERGEVGGGRFLVLEGRARRPGRPSPEGRPFLHRLSYLHGGLRLVHGGRRLGRRLLRQGGRRMSEDE